MKRKIIIVSGTRADYGLLKKLTQNLQDDDQFEAYFVVTGSHLSEKHGNTIEQIKKDNIKNIVEIDIKISGDRPLDICNSLSIGMSSFSDCYEKIKPEFIVVLGDRYELWAACIPATIYNIPIVHIHGGESTQGAIDEMIRHSITKMSHLHLCSHVEYRRRIIQMGEQPERVHVVGAVGLDRIKEMSFLSRDQLSMELNVKFGKKNILCTFHPVTIDERESILEVEAITAAIEKIIKNDDIKIFITFSNADTYSSEIQKKWDKMISKYENKIHGFVSLGDLKYLSLMKEVDLVLGNSSSGILEAPFMSKAVVNVGVRQKGRLVSDHVIQVDAEENEILSSVSHALSDEFQNKLNKIESIYGDGNSNEKILKIIKNTDLKKSNIKIFYDETLK